MAKERIEKTLIILDEDEVRRVLQVGQCDDPEEALRFLTQVIAKKVEAALRQRCR